MSPFRRRISVALLALALALVASPPVSDAAAANREEESTSGWMWPVAGQRSVIAPFRAPAHEYGPGHRGMDVRTSPGAQLMAPTDGVVAFRGIVVDRPLLTVETDDGYVLTFEPVESTHAPGDRVRSGAVLGVVASGGHSTAGSMHVGVRLNGDYLNPLPLFGNVPRAILLPCC